MAKVLIIGAGGVGHVVAHKCASCGAFSQIMLASRTKSKCDRIADSIKNKKILTAGIDAEDVPALVSLIKSFGPDILINVALPYQDLAIMEACLQTGVAYVDTANYEPKNEAKFCYKWQWDLDGEFKKKKLMALLGSGFDPGVTNVFTAWIKKHELDTIEELDIIDANAGSHGQPFATNFNPEINIREVTARGKFWEKGRWRETEPMSVKEQFDFPDNIGKMNIYLMYHEELESIVKHFPEIQKARFWMTFSDNYLKHLEVLQNVGMTRIDEVEYNGVKIIPLQFLKALLPDPASLGPLTKGKTCIGVVAKGKKDGKDKKVYVYNICSHEEAFCEVGSQAISYTTGVPAMIGAMMIAEGLWKGIGVFNMEQFDPDPFMDALNRHGLPWIKEILPL